MGLEGRAEEREEARTVKGGENEGERRRKRRDGEEGDREEGRRREEGMSRWEEEMTR